MSDNLKTILSHSHVTWDSQITGNLRAPRKWNKIALSYNKNQPVVPKPQIYFILECHYKFWTVFQPLSGVQDCIKSKSMCQTDTADCFLARWCIWFIFLKKYIKLLGTDFFLMSAHPVSKIWIIQEPNKLVLWNELHFEEKETECIKHVQIFSYSLCWIKIWNAKFGG